MQFSQSSYKEKVYKSKPEKSPDIRNKGKKLNKRKRGKERYTEG